jgi:polar amino acid transport system substrate-binding protein/glutamate/aspartate transport system substrate-binding protein
MDAVTKTTKEPPMRNILLMALASLLLVTGPTVAGTLDRIKETGTLRIGYRTDAAPFSFKNSIGEASGYSVALCQTVGLGLEVFLGIKDIKFEFVPVTTADRFKAVDESRVDILCGATTATLSRRETVDFSLPTFVDGAGVMFHKDGPSSFEKLAGKNVGVRANTTTESALSNTLEKLEIKAEIVSVTDHEKALEMLESRQLDAYFADRAILSYLIAGRQITNMVISPQTFSIEPYALALKRGDTDFRLAVDRALR